MTIEAVKWMGDTDGVLELIDQRRLPAEFVRLKIRSVEQLHEAIRTLTVRGAPAIGVAAAYGPVLALQWLTGRPSLPEAVNEVLKACDYLASSRPTAVNLFWALDRLRAKASEAAEDPDMTVRGLQIALLAEANAIYDEDVRMCRQIGENGEHLIRDGFGVLTVSRVTGHGIGTSKEDGSTKHGRCGRVSL